MTVVFKYHFRRDTSNLLLAENPLLLCIVRLLGIISRLIRTLLPCLDCRVDDFVASMLDFGM